MMSGERTTVIIAGRIYQSIFGKEIVRGRGSIQLIGIRFFFCLFLALLVNFFHGRVILHIAVYDFFRLLAGGEPIIYKRFQVIF